jgi:hypothetical protein
LCLSEPDARAARIFNCTKLVSNDDCPTSKDCDFTVSTSDFTQSRKAAKDRKEEEKRRGKYYADALPVEMPSSFLAPLRETFISKIEERRLRGNAAERTYAVFSRRKRIIEAPSSRRSNEIAQNGEPMEKSTSAGSVDNRNEGSRFPERKCDAGRHP